MLARASCLPYHYRRSVYYRIDLVAPSYVESKRAPGAVVGCGIGLACLSASAGYQPILHSGLGTESAPCVMSWS